MGMFKDGKKENRLGGDYRKVWTEFKNGGVEVVQYDEQMKDLYINDFMRFQDLNSPYGSSSGSGSAPAPSSGRLTGVVVSFELSSSCYATSTIREICKGPVGGEFMKNVSLG